LLLLDFFEQEGFVSTDYIDKIKSTKIFTNGAKSQKKKQSREQGRILRVQCRGVWCTTGTSVSLRIEASLLC
jgi:hypothetical protein